MTKRAREDDEAPADGDSSRDAAIEQTATSPAKIIELDASDAPANTHKMQCSLPPHVLLSFASGEDFDIHYAKEHTNRCSTCGRNLPSAHYLALHIDENHNPLREELAAKGEKTYACFVEDCEKLCSTPQKRRLHLIDKHGFPKMYNFRIIDNGIDKSSSLLQGGQRRRLSVNVVARDRRDSYTSTSEQQSASQSSFNSHSSTVDENQTAEQAAIDIDEISNLEKSFAALKFIPPSVQARHRNKKKS